MRISGTLLKEHVDAFLEASQNGFFERIIIASASGVSPVVAKLLKRQKVPVRLILRDGLAESRLDWSPWADGAAPPRRAVLPPPPRPPLGGRFLTEEQILAWADEHRKRTGKWPKSGSGIIAFTNGERWKRVDNALERGVRGLPGGSSLAKFLAARRGIKPGQGVPCR